MKSLVLIVLLTLLAASAIAQPPTIVNPAQAPRHRDVHYDEIWRAGDDDEAYIFGVITDAAADPQGNVYLLDSQQQQVFKFSKDGRYLGLIARKGEGPGEIDRAYSLVMMGSDRLGMLKGFPGELIVVGLDGTPLPGVHPAAPALDRPAAVGMLSRMSWRDGFMVSQGQVFHAAGQSQRKTDYLVSLTPDGAVRHCFGTHLGGYDFTRPITVDEVGDGFAESRWTLGRGGELYLAPVRDRWLIEVRDPDGNLLRTITRPWQPVRRTAAQKQAAKNQYSFSSTDNLPPISYKIADTFPAIGSLYFVNDELFVWSDEEQPPSGDGGTRWFDVLDSAGHLRERRTLHVPLVPEQDHLIFLDDGRLVRVRGLYAALTASMAGTAVQVGDSVRTGSDEAGLEKLEVIVYGPRPE